jgi:hypothetical protein
MDFSLKRDWGCLEELHCDDEELCGLQDGRLAHQSVSEWLLCSRACVKDFACIRPSNPHYNPEEDIINNP